MEKSLIVIFILMATALFADPSANEIMAHNDNLKRYVDSSNQTTMVLINSRGNKKIRKMKFYTSDTDIGKNSFIEFLLPADVRGTKFLTIGNDEGDDDQRLFLPALNRIRKISSSGKKGKFMGSDITYYDMENRTLDDSTYKLLKEDNIDGKSYWIIESTPVDLDSPYSKVLSYVSMHDYFIYKKEMYDDRGNHIKTLTIIEVKVVDGVIVPIKSIFENFKDDHKTLLSVADIVLDSNIDESIFSIQNLK